MNNSGLIYKGVFDGKNHSIKGIYINETNKEQQGVFGKQSGTIENLVVEDSRITAKRIVGGICGYNTAGKIVGCRFVGHVKASENSNGTSAAGGICGNNVKNAIIEQCENQGEINGSGDRVGGVCGNNAAIIKKCKNSGNVEGENIVGGICGSHSNRAGKVIECSNTGDVKATKLYGGGICGQNGINGSEGGVIEKCANQGTVTANLHVGASCIL